MNKNIPIPKDIHDRLAKEYRRMLAESRRNPWMTFPEFIVAVIKLGERKFMELAGKNPIGLAEFLDFVENELRGLV